MECTSQVLGPYIPTITTSQAEINLVITWQPGGRVVAKTNLIEGLRVDVTQLAFVFSNPPAALMKHFKMVPILPTQHFRFVLTLHYK
jgi:hypothetical protein